MIVSANKLVVPHDPIALQKELWPDVSFYSKQQEVIYSVANNDETIVPAGNMLGKDFVAGFIVLWFFLTRSPCRIVTTSAKDDHLRVLWGEIGNFISTSVIPLDQARGGPLVINQRELRKVNNSGEEIKKSYVIGMVASEDKMAAMQGHHIAQTGDSVPRTLFLADECSSIPQAYYVMARTWANRVLGIGNPWPCNNFFKHAVTGQPGTNDKGGDIPSSDRKYFYRKVIQIKAIDSPNVRLGIAQKDNGKEPTGQIIIPGVKPYNEYIKNRKLWNTIEQSVGLDAEFYEGFSVMLYPKEWLELASKRRHTNSRGTKITMGVDSAEGNDNTCWAICNESGLIEILGLKTPDTTEIVSRTLGLMSQYKVRPENVLFDRGGGGKQHADVLRQKGHNVTTVAFGAAPSPDKRKGHSTVQMRTKDVETSSIYKNRRAEMYASLRTMLRPDGDYQFALPHNLLHRKRTDGGPSLYEQLVPMPLLYDGEGKMYLPPKRKKDPKDKAESLLEILGCSPDEADALVLATFGLLRKPPKRVAGGLK
jgi:hypothetical protein